MPRRCDLAAGFDQPGQRSPGDVARAVQADCRDAVDQPVQLALRRVASLFRQIPRPGNVSVQTRCRMLLVCRRAKGGSSVVDGWIGARPSEEQLPRLSRRWQAGPFFGCGVSTEPVPYRRFEVVQQREVIRSLPSQRQRIAQCRQSGMGPEEREDAHCRGALVFDAVVEVAMPLSGRAQPALGFVAEEARYRGRSGVPG